jgi:hypothetical protein
MSVATEELVRELDEWTASGIVARFWWRDDDAASDTPQLRRLIEGAERIGATVGLGVVPEKADASLANAVATSARFCVWQHGWGHHSHELGEFGDGRALNLMVADAQRGQESLDRLLGPNGWQKVFVPPFHLISLPFKSLIPSLGYLGLSAGEPLTPPIPGVFEVNAEVDVMNWPEGKLHDPVAVSTMLLRQLRSRRLLERPSEEPIGILTHHLAFQHEDWEFISRLSVYLASHPAVQFARVDTLFGGGLENAARPIRSEIEAHKRQDPSITFVLTSCGRQDLLERTLDSFFKYNTHPIRDYIVIEDGDGGRNDRLRDRYRSHDVRWLSTGSHLGQMATIDIAYRGVDTEYIFHCEDDWEFYAPGFVEKSLAVLRENEALLQVWLRSLTDTNNHPMLDKMFLAETVPYRIMQPGYHTDDWGTWHGFSLNPGLRRRRDYLSLGSFGGFDPHGQKKAYEVEREVAAFYWKRGLLAAILADNDGKGYVRHIGWGRRVSEFHG